MTILAQWKQNKEGFSYYINQWVAICEISSRRFKESYQVPSPPQGAKWWVWICPPALVSMDEEVQNL